MQRANSLEKILMLGKIEGRRRRGQKRMRWLYSVTDSMNMSLHKLQELVKDRKDWHVAVCGVSKNWTQLSNWIITTKIIRAILEFQLQHQFFQCIFRTDFFLDWLVWFPCNPRDSQESSPTPQFKSINSSALSLLYSPTLTSIHDHWKNHSLD